MQTNGITIKIFDSKRKVRVIFSSKCMIQNGAIKIYNDIHVVDEDNEGDQKAPRSGMYLNK